jgi:hypothetical protein
MTRLKHLNIALEAIEFQNGAFFKELTLNLEPYFVKNNGLSKDEQRTLGSLLDKIIFRHVGVTTHITFSHYNTCIFVPDVSTRNILNNDWGHFTSAKDGLRMIDFAGENGMSVGIVDLKKSRMSGNFSKYQVRMNVDLGYFSNNFFTAGECAAIILHEVGHWFTYCEMLDRVVTGNMLLDGLSRVLAGGDVKEREIAIKKAADIVNLDENVIQDLQKSTSDKTVVTVFITYVSKKATTREGDSFYDSNTWEMMSDQFAARHGAGRDVVTALDKLTTRLGDTHQRKSNIMYYIGEVINVTVLMLALVITINTAFVSFVSTVISVLCLGLSYSWISFAHLRDDVPEYDKPKDRFLRIRRQLIEQIKDTSLSSEVIKSFIQDIKVIDDVISNYAERANWLETIDNFLFNSSRRRRDNTDFQRDLEKLAMNDLFLSAASLRTI